MTEGKWKKDLYEDYAFEGLSREEAIAMEATLKAEYECSDHASEEGTGYVMQDKDSGESYFFSANARFVLETRYLEKDKHMRVSENLLDLLTRVAVNIASAELKYGYDKKFVQEKAEKYLRMFLTKDFMPNTPTLCNAGRQLQQLSACFVLPVDDYMATDDIGEDPEKQGEGIYDTIRYAAMIHKSGGGTGYNFSRLRAKGDRISTTFGSSSGPVSFMTAFDGATEAVNQGGFRRGANMGILNYNHPDIFGFVYEKTKGTLRNFNLSVGVDDAFMEAALAGRAIRLHNPKDRNRIPLEQRVLTADRLIQEQNFDIDSPAWQSFKDEFVKSDQSKSTEDVVAQLKREGYYDILASERLEGLRKCNSEISEEELEHLARNYIDKLVEADLAMKSEQVAERLNKDKYYEKKTKDAINGKKKEHKRVLDEMEPSIILAEDGQKIILKYTKEQVGEVGERGEVLIYASALLDYIADRAKHIGCPGLIFLDNINKYNPTPNMGEIESTNPCGEQPLLPFEACNLGAINLKNCVRGREVDWGKLEELTKEGVRFLDSVIDKSKFPFKRVYSRVKGNRKIGLGFMGLGEMFFKLGMAYDSEEAVELARKISTFVTETGRNESERLGEERGVFPNWKGSVYDPDANLDEKYVREGRAGKKVRNATVTTIAPNGTTGMIADASGGIEPVFSLFFTKTCMDGRELYYKVDGLDDALNRIEWADKEELLFKIKENGGSLQNIDGIPEDVKKVFKTAHDIDVEWHIRMQAAVQQGLGKGRGIDNAVSKTINMPSDTTVEEVREAYVNAWRSGLKGITVYVDGSKSGQVLTKSKRRELSDYVVESHEVSLPRILKQKAKTVKYKIARPQGGSLHVVITDDLYLDEESGKAYLIPAEIFQEKAPLGDKSSVDFAQSGMDRTEILSNSNPNYAELIIRWKSAASSESEGIGPGKVKSTHHAVGVAFEHHLLEHGIVGYDAGGNLENLVDKSRLKRVESWDEIKAIMSAQNGNSGGKKIKMKVTGNVRIGERFECECGSTEFTYKDGCHSPACARCGNIPTGNCG